MTSRISAFSLYIVEFANKFYLYISISLLTCVDLLLVKRPHPENRIEFSWIRCSESHAGYTGMILRKLSMHWANTSRCLGGCEAIRFYFLFFSPLFSDFSAFSFFRYTQNIHTLAWRHCIEKKKKISANRRYSLLFLEKVWKISITSFSIPPSLLKGVLWCVHSVDVENTLQSHWGTIEREWWKRSVLWRVHKMRREFQEMFYTWCSSLFSSLFFKKNNKKNSTCFLPHPLFIPASVV